MKKTFIIFTITCLIVLSSCMTADKAVTSSGPKQPGWMQDLEKAYPSSIYLASIGSGRNLEDAQRQATSSLSAMFKVRVEGKLSVLQGFGEVAGPDGITRRETTQVIDMVDQQVDSTLYYVKFSEPWDNGKGEVYVTAYMKREEAGKTYSELIDSNNRDILMLSRRADKQDSALGRFALYDSTFMKVLENKVLNEQLKLIMPSMMREPAYDETRMAEKRQNASSNLTFAVSISGDSDDRAGRTLLEEIEQRGMTAGNTADTAYLIEGSWNTWPITVDNGYENLQWRLELSLLDENGQILLTYDYEQKDAGLNLEAAYRRVNMEVERRLKEDFMMKRFDTYLAGFSK